MNGHAGAPAANEMHRDGGAHMEDTPAYYALKPLLCTKYRRADIEDVFTGVDLKANSSKQKNMQKRLKWGVYCCIGSPFYYATHVEMFVPAGHVAFFVHSRR